MRSYRLVIEVIAIFRSISTDPPIFAMG